MLEAQLKANAQVMEIVKGIKQASSVRGRLSRR
jgi:hypothetical protein